MHPSSSSMSGAPGSADWMRARSVVTFSDIGPCLNDHCAFMERRRPGALVSVGNSDVRIAARVQSARESTQRKNCDLPTRLSTVDFSRDPGLDHLTSSQHIKSCKCYMDAPEGST